MMVLRNVILTLFAGIVLLVSGLYSSHTSQSVSVIGGSDGPTAIYVSTTVTEVQPEAESAAQTPAPTETPAP